MKAVNYKGAFKVKVEEVEKPQLEHPDDIIVKVTTVSSPNQLLFPNSKSHANRQGCDLWL